MGGLSTPTFHPEASIEPSGLNFSPFPTWLIELGRLNSPPVSWDSPLAPRLPAGTWQVVGRLSAIIVYSLLALCQVPM